MRCSNEKDHSFYSGHSIKYCNTDDYRKYITDILRAEADIAECMSEFLCRLLHKIDLHCSLPEKVELVKEILCAFSCKEKAMADLIRALNEHKKSKC